MDSIHFEDRGPAASDPFFFNEQAPSNQRAHTSYLFLSGLFFYAKEWLDFQETLARYFPFFLLSGPPVTMNICFPSSFFPLR